MTSAGILAVLLLLSYVVDYNGGQRAFGTLLGSELRLLLIMKQALMTVNAVALPVFIYGLWQKKSWAFLGINVIAAVCLALVMTQGAVLGFRPSGFYWMLVTLAAIATLALSSQQPLRNHVGVQPLNRRNEALKWGAAALAVCAGIAVVAISYVSPASAGLRVQAYADLERDAELSKLPRCKWATPVAVCLPLQYSVRPSGAGAIIQRNSPDDAVLAVSENIWSQLGTALGFDSGYDFQLALWDTAYFPLLYTALKRAMYVEGMAIYRLQTTKARSLVQVQQQEGRWQVIATIYSWDRGSLQLMSAHGDKREALIPILTAVNAY